LVPRSLAIWGLVGYAIIFFRMVSEVMGSGLGMVSSIPGGLWELFIGVWLIAKGFNPSAFASQSTNPDDVVLMGVQEPAVVPSNGHVTSKG
jgi:hypothetical protein